MSRVIVLLRTAALLWAVMVARSEESKNEIGM